MDLGYIWQRIKWSPVPFHCFVHLPKIDTCNHGRVPFSVLSLGFQQATNTILKQNQDAVVKLQVEGVLDVSLHKTGDMLHFKCRQLCTHTHTGLGLEWWNV